MDKLINIKENEFVKPVWIKDLGNYNYMPEPYYEITESEYINYQGLYSPMYRETRQVQNKDVFTSERGSYRNVTIFWYFDRGIAIVWPNEWTLVADSVVYTRDIRYFKIGCNHMNVELSQKECWDNKINHYGTCYHVNRCTLCGLVTSYSMRDIENAYRMLGLNDSIY
jgi:hypothetical protein